MHTGTSTQYDVAPNSTVSDDSAIAGARAYLPYHEQEYRDPPVHSFSDDDFSDENNSVAEEDEVSSDNLESKSRLKT